MEDNPLQGKVIKEFTSTTLQRHFKDVLSESLGEGIICVTSGDVKFFLLSKEFFTQLLSTNKLKIDLGE